MSNHFLSILSPSPLPPHFWKTPLPLCILLLLLLLPRLSHFSDLLQELGVSILQDLQRQRETIVHASDALRGADDSIAGARRILGVMSRRVAANKMIAWGVAGALGLCVLVILWAKIRR
jgi:hypothetical protein